MKTLFTKFTALLLVFLLCFAMASCAAPGGTGDGGSGDGGSGDGGNADTKTATSYVGIDINPSVELTVSEDGTVVSVYGSNEDGQILLYEEESNIVGKDVEAAIDCITALAAELGYLAEGDDVATTVTAPTEEATNVLRSKVNAKIVSSAEEMGIEVTASAQTAFELLCELREFKANYPENASVQSLTPEKYRLAVSAAKGGEITVEAAAALSNEQLISKINEAHSTLETYATDAYLEAKARAVAMFESSMGVICDGIYTQVYTERSATIFSNPAYINTIHYGATYQAYKTSARTYLAVLEIMSFADEYTGLEIPEQTVSELCAALGISDSSVLADNDGKITLGGVIDYCNEFVKENNVSDEVKERVEEILAEARDAAELVVIASDAYAADLAALKSSVEGVISTVTSVSSTVLPLLPTAAKAELEACLADLQATALKLSDIMENGSTDGEIISLAGEAEKKASEMLEKINADLTEEEKTRVETLKSALDQQIATLTGSFESRLASAEAEAKQYIADKRAQRLAANDNE